MALPYPKNQQLKNIKTFTVTLGRKYLFLQTQRLSVLLLVFFVVPICRVLKPPMDVMVHNVHFEAAEENIDARACAMTCVRGPDAMEMNIGEGCEGTMG